MRNAVIILGFAIAVIAFGFACSQKPDTPDEPMKFESEADTVRGRAERVGEFSDRIMTNDLKKNLTGIVDSNAEHNKELEEAGSDY